MDQQDLASFLEHSGKDPSRLIFEDELTGIYNRRFLYHYLQSKIQWNLIEERPLSLIMLDVDKFKEINDTHGHQTGDLALVWVAGLLKEVGRQGGLAFRYAGDEFILLLPGIDKHAALKRGELLQNRIRNEASRPGTLESSLGITLSLGIASAPEDAKDGKKLIQKADTALYSAKKRGRDCFVNASEVDPAEVFAKTAIYRFDEAKIVGRARQVTLLTDALENFNKKKSQFLILEGPAGIGKTELMEAVRQHLSRNKIWMVKVNGSTQEMFRPYYLTTKILVELLNKREDSGAEVLDKMSPQERSYLAQIVPQLGGEVEVADDEDGGRVREGIFSALVQLIPQIVDHKPLILFIDDLHLGDEATMLLLRRMILRKDIPIFVCSTATDSKGAKGEEGKGPLERFYETYYQELGIQKVPLTPFTPSDVATQIRVIFPNVRIPENFEKDLARICQGNPLFISEILRKLVSDQKITLEGQQWVIKPVEEGYLPRSLEEIVAQKIDALDKESRQMLEQVSAHGEDVPLSMLVGSVNAMEAKVLEFIDQAIDSGLLQSDFQLNDEVIGFLGKRVLEFTYGRIEENRRLQLHGRIGNHQESLYQRQILPSAATLAYHFKRSTDQEKARDYEKILSTSNRRRFNAEEAAQYTGEMESVGLESNVPLDSEGMASMPKLIRDFTVAIRSVKLYPPGSDSITKVTRQLKRTVDRVLKSNERINIIEVEQGIEINGQQVDTEEFKVVARSFLKFLDRFQLKGVAFNRGLTDVELETMLTAFAQTDQRTFEDDYWERLTAERGMSHIELRQALYERKERLVSKGVGQKRQSTEPKETPHPIASELNPQDLRLLMEIMRSLLGAVRAIKLYPLHSRVITTLLENVTGNLRSFIKNRGGLTLSRAEDALLANGVKVANPAVRSFADRFQEYLAGIGLSSLTFLEGFTDNEIEVFIAIHRDLTAGEVESTLWERLATEEGLSGVLFDSHVYEVRLAESAVPLEVVEIPVESPVPEPEPQPEEKTDRESFSSMLESFPGKVRRTILKKKDDEIGKMTQRLFEAFPDQEISARRRTIEVCRELLDSLTPALQYDLVKFLTDPLLAAFSQEKNPDVTVLMAAFLGSMVSSLVELVAYRTAARILAEIYKRSQELEETKDSHAQMLTKTLERNLEASTQKLLIEDLKSGDHNRVRNATLLLGAMGHAAVPFLVEIIKGEDDYRTRRIAAILLKKQGPEAVERVKNLLVLEGASEARFRILEVIDTLTIDLKKELSHAMGDEDPDVREAAFRLADRIKSNQTMELLLDLARNESVDLAASAIKGLGNIKAPRAYEGLISILESSKDEGISVVCCKALGRIADPAAIEPLSKILNKKGFFLFRKKPSARLRAAAAFALAQISHHKVSEALAPFVEDKDPRVREIAKAVVKKTGSSKS